MQRKNNKGQFIRGERIKRVCLFCNKEFQIVPCKELTAKFCSRLCQTRFIGKLPKKWPNNIGKSNLGRKRPDASLRMKQNKGEKSSNWKGGGTPAEKGLRLTPEYKLWRKAVFERDGYACVWCEASSGKGRPVVLNADHIISFSDIIKKLKFEQGVENIYEKALTYELLWDINNGRTLCVDCHRKTDNYGRKKIKSEIDNYQLQTS